MEHKFLIDLSVKFGLSDERLSKVVDMVYQLGFDDLNDKGFQDAATMICKNDLVDLPPEEVLEEMKKLTSS